MGSNKVVIKWLVGGFPLRALDAILVFYNTYPGTLKGPDDVVQGSHYPDEQLT